MTFSFARDRAEYDRFRSRAAQVVDLGSPFPGWPFRSTTGQVDLCELNEFSGEDFARALETLARTYGDESVSLVVVRPEPDEYHVPDLGHFPCFSVPTRDLARSYWEAVSYEPQGDPGGSVLYADAFAIFGGSGEWAVWGQREWEVVAVHAEGTARPWRDGTDIFVSPRTAVDRFIQPELGGSRWSREQIDAFVSVVSGPSSLRSAGRS